MNARQQWAQATIYNPTIYLTISTFLGWQKTLRPMEFSIKFDTVKPGWSIVNIEGSQVIISKNFSEDWFCLSKQYSLEVPDEMPQYAHLGLLFAIIPV